MGIGWRNIWIEPSKSGKLCHNDADQTSQKWEVATKICRLCNNHRLVPPLLTWFCCLRWWSFKKILRFFIDKTSRTRLQWWIWYSPNSPLNSDVSFHRLMCSSPAFQVSRLPGVPAVFLQDQHGSLVAWLSIGQLGDYLGFAMLRGSPTRRLSCESAVVRSTKHCEELSLVVAETKRAKAA